MTVTIKTTNYAFLEKVGVDQPLIDQLKELNIKLALGFYDLKLIAPNGAEVGEYKLQKNTNELMKSSVPEAILMAIRSGLKKLITEAVQKVKSGAPTQPIPVKPETSFQDQLKAAMQQAGVDNGALSEQAKEPVPQVQGPPMATTLKPNVTIKEMLAMEPVPLKMASMLYQPVKGSSAGSRYFVVALNSMCKVAARIQGSSVSVRVEGTLPDNVKMAWAAQSIEDHGGYMSGHFETNDKVSPERLIGAVLMGTGLQFDTPLPSLMAIKNVK